MSDTIKELQATGKIPVYKVETYNFDATPYDVTITKSVTGKTGVVWEVKVRGSELQTAAKECLAIYKTLVELLGIEEKPVKEVKKNE